VDDGATIGAGTRDLAFLSRDGGAVIGERCSLGQNVVVMNEVKIGNNVKIQNNVSVYDGVELEDDVFLRTVDGFHERHQSAKSLVPRKDEYRKTLVKRAASIGANATIVCGTTLGEYSFIGAGSVVTSDVPGLRADCRRSRRRRVGWMCQVR
jgi:UDP-2-acetamido-3-amino-2,3-dideoxy-glucuronate N-acetyltransferase